jgi:outer membrane lipoprotein-sorting protein
MGALRMSGNKQAVVAIAFGLMLSPWLAAGTALAADAKKAAGGPQAAAPAAKLSVAQIVEKHMAARGGAAWKSVQTLQLTGKVEVGKGDSVERSNALFEANKNLRGQQAGLKPAAAAEEGKAQADKQVELPFTLDVKRPHKSRLEVAFAGKTAWQVYDGQKGWKFRPFLHRTDIEPFTADELKTEAGQDNMEGALFDHAAKGAQVALEKVEAVEGNDAYKLKLVAKDGSTRYVWIDARTFLDVKVQGTPRRMDGKMHDVFVMQRDFRLVQGVMVPFVVETSVDGYPDTHKMRIENVAVNPKLDDALFTKPHA